ncbi:uncharacterized protein L969DRAFT_16885 [Mixia osmundae IAM 14324]|uniref:N-acetylglucosaminylphosphatidylinositol deacetylase n=1 Tax=Mixia osmundae (strain CBS 9802 / IAM 14324 / JCM 22182 / KY 12970) TaxID=764103 RepID=G7E8W4_MIXOS|nr:uncharacterized protein L969DRAFT_16885 [Mixia osmundae IAM 14324]KEI40217.1 hypothetical protein L969DRAFT_16885 [Mixia osmundae IAM 14324]GAA99582.1 hypothetical protein E5Q_06283 [Mixia osmundae IAM 14324]
MANRRSSYENETDALIEDEAAPLYDGEYPPKRWSRQPKFSLAKLRPDLSKPWPPVVRLVLLLIVLVPLVNWIALAYVFSRSAAFFPPLLRTSKQVLLLAAHPDDECLFFSPAITSILQRADDATGHVLIMSSGNHYGLGAQRRIELKGSCKALGIAEQNCDVLNTTDIQDDPTYWWPEERLVELIKDHVARWNIDTIVTFDSGGVSGHINHRAVSAAAVALAKQEGAPNVYTSATVNVLRKYSALLDLPLTSLAFVPRFLTLSDSNNHALLVGTFSQYLAARKAFHSHKSQMVWDRYLYMLVSRYMYFNTLSLSQS